MPTVRTGGGGSGSAATLGVTAELKKISREDRIFYLEPDSSVLLLLLRRIGKKMVGAVKHEWLETEHIPLGDAVNNSGGYTAGATSVVVDNGGYFAVNSLVKVPRTNEVMHITAISTNTLTVVRSWGGTAAAALLDNDPLLRLGGAAAELATAEDPKQVVEANAYNITQIFRDGFGASRSLQKSDLYGGDYLTRIGKERGVDHRKQIEMALFEGERASNTSGNYERRSMGGIREFISTYSRAFGGTVTLEGLFDFAEDAFRYGSKTKTFFMGRAPVSNVSLVAKDHLEVVNEAKALGLDIKSLLTPHGRWNIVSHPLFETGVYANGGFSLDLKNLMYVYLRDSDTQLNMDIQTNDADGREHEWLTECSLVRKIEKTHALATGMAA